MYRVGEEHEPVDDEVVVATQVDRRPNVELGAQEPEDHVFRRSRIRKYKLSPQRRTPAMPHFPPIAAPPPAPRGTPRLARGALRSLAMSERFKVNLRGIIELLSNHLYGSPDVFLRELLQNSADALVARGLVTPGHTGRIAIEWVPRADGPPALQFRDDGVGLSEDEIHRFLATIGESSKRGDVFAASKDFIGRFGIGLLSCFMVSDEVQVITRSARMPHWRRSTHSQRDALVSRRKIPRKAHGT